MRSVGAGLNCPGLARRLLVSGCGASRHEPQISCVEIGGADTDQRGDLDRRRGAEGGLVAGEVRLLHPQFWRQRRGGWR